MPIQIFITGMILTKYMRKINLKEFGTFSQKILNIVKLFCDLVI